MPRRYPIPPRTPSCDRCYEGKMRCSLVTAPFTTAVTECDQCVRRGNNCTNVRKTKSNRQPSCSNCYNARLACNKLSPCSRCLEKGFTCEPRSNEATSVSNAPTSTNVGESSGAVPRSLPRLPLLNAVLDAGLHTCRLFGTKPPVKVMKFWLTIM